MSLDTLAIVACSVLTLVGLVVTTLGVFGMFRMPDVYTQVHAASKAVAFGVIALLAATATTGDLAIAGRALLVAFFLALTMPVSAHVIALAAYRRGERPRGDRGVDETGPEAPHRRRG